jgi:ABC-2 type transport system ATP-binding protein
MHLLTGQLLPTEGEIRIGGQTPFENRDVLKRICFVKESQQYIKHLTVSQTLELAQTLFPHWDEAFAGQLMEAFGLPARRKIKQLSRGMESALGIIIGLASRAPITLFDEPYLGLDAAGRNLFYERLLQDYTEHPRTIILSTHLIDEVSKLFERILIIHQGRLLVNEDAERLRQMAYTVSGRNDLVERFVADKQVLHAEALGAHQVAAVFGTCPPEVRRQAEANGLVFGMLSLQKLFIYLTEKRVNGQ